MRRSRLLAAGLTATMLVVPLVDDLTTVASGLDNPRGLVADRRGDVYVALSGRGTDAATPGMTAEEAAALDLPCFTGPEGLTCLGDTGAIGLLDTHRRHRHARGTVRFRTVVDGLPSVAPPGGGNALGVTDVSVDSRGRLFATIGLGGDPSLRQAALGDDDLAAQLATLGRVDLRRGTVREVADLGDVEAETNPAGGTVDTNPYALVAGRRGHVVVDAGGNSLLTVGRDGSVELEHVFPDELVTVPPPAGGDGTVQAPAQAVPNAVVRGPGGAYYIGQLTGGPFGEGAATVWRWEPGAEPEVYADGFTHIIDLAFTPDGDLLVLQIARRSLLYAFTAGTGPVPSSSSRGVTRTSGTSSSSTTRVSRSPTRMAGRCSSPPVAWPSTATRSTCRTGASWPEAVRCCVSSSTTERGPRRPPPYSPECQRIGHGLRPTGRAAECRMC